MTKRAAATLIALIGTTLLFLCACSRLQPVTAPQSTVSAGEKTPDPAHSSPATGSTVYASNSNTTRLPLKLAPGFSISFFARNTGGPRVLERDPSGTLICSLTRNGLVVALPDANNDGVADKVVNVAGSLSQPHGIAFRCKDKCQIYIAETHQVSVYDYNRETFKATGKRVLAKLPSGGGHYTRTILFLPPPNDNILLVSAGSSCNVCKEEDWRRASVMQLDVDTGKLSPFATGLRNSVFMAVNPETNEIWATDNGRDLLGDNTPPDEINILKQGKFYGFPFCYGKNIVDTTFDNSSLARSRCAEATPSHINLPAHSAALGIAFFPLEGWPENFKGDFLVAYHGSWNRTIPTGYKVVRFHRNQGGNYTAEDFITGWLTGSGSVLGRPAGILISRDKTIFISDDRAGVIYRVVYQR